MQVEDLIQKWSILDPLLSLDLLLSNLFHNLFHCFWIQLFPNYEDVNISYNGPKFLTYCFSLGK